MQRINGNQIATVVSAANAFAAVEKLAMADRNAPVGRGYGSKRAGRGSGSMCSDRWRHDHTYRHERCRTTTTSTSSVSTSPVVTPPVPVDLVLPPPVYAALVLSRSLCG